MIKSRLQLCRAEFFSLADVFYFFTKISGNLFSSWKTSKWVEYHHTFLPALVLCWVNLTPSFLVVIIFCRYASSLYKSSLAMVNGPRPSIIYIQKNEIHCHCVGLTKFLIQNPAVHLDTVGSNRQESRRRKLHFLNHCPRRDINLPFF